VSDDQAQRFSAMYGALYGRIRAYAARRVGADAADEIADETFMVAWRHFEDVPTEPLPWLYGVARHVVQRYRARFAREAATRDALRRERSISPDVAEGYDEVLWDAWQDLREADREVLSLIAWEELPVAEAARALGCSAPVFSVRLHRARRRLERLLAQRAESSRPVSTLSEAS
jgi:RNA polymerase sigma-70 factor, ECF subfamily